MKTLEDRVGMLHKASGALDEVIGLCGEYDIKYRDTSGNCRGESKIRKIYHKLNLSNTVLTDDTMVKLNVMDSIINDCNLLIELTQVEHEGYNRTISSIIFYDMLTRFYVLSQEETKKNPNIQITNIISEDVKRDIEDNCEGFARNIIGNVQDTIKDRLDTKRSTLYEIFIMNKHIGNVELYIKFNSNKSKQKLIKAVDDYIHGGIGIEQYRDTGKSMDNEYNYDKYLIDIGEICKVIKDKLMAEYYGDTLAILKKDKAYQGIDPDGKIIMLLQ